MAIILLALRLQYVDWAAMECLKDCPPSASDADCGGIAATGSEFLQTQELCCALKLPWVCTGSDAAPAGSNNWYVDWVSNKCVKDCVEGGSDPSCGGLATKNDLPLFGDSNSCCSTKMPWNNDCAK